MTYEEYLTAVQSAILRNPTWRAGQAYFNVLHEVRPDLSEKIRATALDPFYGSVVGPAFFEFVSSNWDVS